MDSNDCRGREGREGNRHRSQWMWSTRRMQRHSKCNMKLQWTLRYTCTVVIVVLLCGIESTIFVGQLAPFDHALPNLLTMYYLMAATGKLNQDRVQNTSHTNVHRVLRSRVLQNGTKTPTLTWNEDRTYSNAHVHE